MNGNAFASKDNDPVTWTSQNVSDVIHHLVITHLTQTVIKNLEDILCSISILLQ